MPNRRELSANTEGVVVMTECERCAYYDGARFGGAVCLIIESSPDAGATCGDDCRFFCDVEKDNEPCFRVREGKRWMCYFKGSTSCMWNDGKGTCHHEHPTSPSPLMEPES